jgi:bifunctional ADP-heptose synthase (sugar kinase/adenylyltransferase)
LFLDTRSKIVPLDQIRILQDRTARWISGHFDPLLAEHVGRLRRAREPGSLLVVEVTNPARPLLSQRARAELVAALAMVDYVVLSNVEPDTGLPAGPPLDADLSQRFIDHVLERYRQESGREESGA